MCAESVLRGTCLTLPGAGIPPPGGIPPGGIPPVAGAHRRTCRLPGLQFHKTELATLIALQGHQTPPRARWSSCRTRDLGTEPARLITSCPTRSMSPGRGVTVLAELTLLYWRTESVGQDRGHGSCSGRTKADRLFLDPVRITGLCSPSRSCTS